MLDSYRRSERLFLRLYPGEARRWSGSVFLLAAILADKGDYPGALEQIRGYMSFAPDAPDIEAIQKELDRQGVRYT